MPKGFEITITNEEYDLIVTNIINEHKTMLISLCREAQSKVNQTYTEVIKYGIENNGNEILYVLDVKTGENVFKPVTGTNNGIDSEELKEFLKNAKSDSLIVIHNHPNNASFSTADIYSALKYDSVSLTSAIGHDGSIYELWIGNNTRNIPYEQLQTRYFELKKELPINNDYTVFSKLEREQMLRNDIIEIICSENGWDYWRGYYFEEII